MSKIRKTSILLGAVIAIIQMTSSASIDPAISTMPPPSTLLFAGDLLRQMVKSKSTENVVFSPMSIQTALAMTYLGAAGITAEELQKTLHLPSADKDQVGQYFSQLLKKKSGEADLSIANRMFVSSDFPLKADFNKRTENYFKSGAEAVNFKNLPSEAIQTINTWVENKTNNKITDLMKPGSVDSDTVAVIVNAIYFKGKWKNPFSKDSTRKNEFWINKDESVQVDTMFGSDMRIKYGEFPELDAIAIELPYKQSDLSMMLILPSEKDGLANLESKLGSISINEMSSKMTPRKVDVMLPKFKIDFSTGLSDVLKEMGIRSLFQKADLPGIFESGPAVKVSDVQHKAFIDVNEAGSEAAAASFVQISLMSLDYDQKFVKFDRPFFFAIKDSNAIYFAGHVAKL